MLNIDLLLTGALTGGDIDYHTGEESYRGASPQRVDLKIASDIGKEEPDEGVNTVPLCCPINV